MHRPRAISSLLLASLALAVIGLAISGCSADQSLAGAIRARAASTSGRGGETVLDGIPVGFTQEGYPYRGVADAPVTLVEYSDFLCPYCSRHATQTVPTLLERYIRPGQVKWVFRDSPIASLHPTSPKGHMAADCVAEQGAASFWKMHDQLFANQSQWNQLPDPTAYLAGVAKGIGADMTAYNACMAAGRSKATVDKGIADAAALGFNGTPSFQLVSSKGGAPYVVEGAQAAETFAQSIDALLAGKEPPVAQQQEAQKPQLPVWARPEGLAPDPARPGYTMAGDPYKGNPQAKMAVVEFSDFQCPSCQKHALEVQPALDKQLVDTGDVMWVFKNLPLQEHPQAAAAAAAAECAGEQSQFWQMHDLLFQKMSDWAVKDPDPALNALAGQLKLDGAKFAACLQGRAALERVLADVYDASAVGYSTPTFVALANGQGTIMRGTKPAEQMATALRGILDAAKSGAR
jgi:protein-disulfide isomerase